MCGIVGFLGTPGDEAALRSLVERMSSCLSHRGPDDAGVWVEENVGLAFGHRRLSILDLSPMGHQPMMSRGGQFTMTFNGEIYNYLDIRKELEVSGGPSWRGHSDTEVILEAFARWGIGPTLKRLTGMFALAVWDAADRTLHIARDRLGEKPLYYGFLDSAFVFASELKALRGHPGWKGQIDRNALGLFLRYGYVPTPLSIYSGIGKLWPGTFLSVKPDGTSSENTYWSAREVAEHGISHPFEGNESEAQVELEKLLSHAIGGQMVADVPLGAFLSGGVDSSTVVALMQARSSRPVQTFTIGFHEAGHNEANHAKAVAQHLGTQHTELYVTPDEAMNVIPRLPDLYDEPFSDPSQIPTFLVAQLARRSVTVSLSGDGGDELFGGYNRYFIGRTLWNRVGWVPSAARGLLASAITSVSPANWNRAFAGLTSLAPRRLRYPDPGEKLHKLALVLGARNPDELYHRLTSHWQQPDSVVLSTSATKVSRNGHSEASLSDFTQRMMYLDLVGYLPDDILVKVDRAAMGVSLETRVPMLDHKVVEFAWRLPLSFKIRDGEGKWLLRQVLYKHVPRELIDRPKKGFDVPIGSWLRGPLRSWAEALLDEGRLEREGFFDAHQIRTRWDEHLSGSRDWQQPLWNILMFQAWLEKETHVPSSFDRTINHYSAPMTSL